ncbi:MAG: alpha/beta fold hydrolase [Ignavibacteriales bacterium]
MMKKIINDISVFIEGDVQFKAVLFVHGFPFDHTMWQTLVEELSKKYLCVTYDVRGLGNSPAGDGQLTMEMLVNDLEKIVDELKLDKPVLCGLSMGGYISLRAIERMQDKFSALILCDTKSVADDNEGKLKRAAGIKQINSGDYHNFIEIFVQNCFGEKFIKENNAKFRMVVERSKLNDPIGVKGCLLAMAGRTDTTDSLSKINIPALVICGSEDKISTPDQMRKMSKQIPNSEFVLVEAAGHMTPIEYPEIVNHAIKNFLLKNKK